MLHTLRHRGGRRKNHTRNDRSDLAKHRNALLKEYHARKNMVHKKGKKRTRGKIARVVDKRNTRKIGGADDNAGNENNKYKTGDVVKYKDNNYTFIKNDNKIQLIPCSINNTYSLEGVNVDELKLDDEYFQKYIGDDVSKTLQNAKPVSLNTITAVKDNKTIQTNQKIAEAFGFSLSMVGSIGAVAAIFVEGGIYMATFSIGAAAPMSIPVLVGLAVIVNSLTIRLRKVSELVNTTLLVYNLVEDMEKSMRLMIRYSKELDENDLHDHQKIIDKFCNKLRDVMEIIVRNYTLFGTSYEYGITSEEITVETVNKQKDVVNKLVQKRDKIQKENPWMMSIIYSPTKRNVGRFEKMIFSLGMTVGDNFKSIKKGDKIIFNDDSNIEENNLIKSMKNEVIAENKTIKSMKNEISNETDADVETDVETDDDSQIGGEPKNIFIDAKSNDDYKKIIDNYLKYREYLDIKDQIENQSQLLGEYKHKVNYSMQAPDETTQPKLFAAFSLMKTVKDNTVSGAQKIGESANNIGDDIKNLARPLIKIKNHILGIEIEKLMEKSTKKLFDDAINEVNKKTGGGISDYFSKDSLSRMAQNTRITAPIQNFFARNIPFQDRLGKLYKALFVNEAYFDLIREYIILVNQFSVFNARMTNNMIDEMYTVKTFIKDVLINKVGTTESEQNKLLQKYNNIQKARNARSKRIRDISKDDVKLIEVSISNPSNPQN